MTVFVSPNVVLTQGPGGVDVNADNPIVGYQNLATVNNIESWSAEINYPITNAVNPSTYEKWIGEIGSPELGEEYITITLDTNETVDYVGIAGHNFGTGMFPISIEGLATNEGSPEDWTELNASVLLGNNQPVIFRFAEGSFYQIRIRLQTGQASPAVAPEAAVIYVGKLLILQRRIYVGHTPITYGYRTNVVNGYSEAGNFLGRIILSEHRESMIEMKNITPGWFRNYMVPFIESAQERPFFFNWRPDSYPYETGYCWTGEDIIGANELSNGMMGVEFKIRGISS